MKIQIMVIDDEPLYGELIQNVAELHDIATIGVHDTDYFEAELKAHPNVELIFLDLNMPKRDGIEILRSLGDQEFKGDIILMSGFDESVLESAYSLASEHKLSLKKPITKPFSVKEVGQLIQTHEFESIEDLLEPNTQQIKKRTPQLLSVDEISYALENRGLELHYQPQVSLQTNEIVGFECLARIRRYNGELVYPDRFISVIEGSFPPALFLEKVFDNVISDIKDPLAGLEQHISVNLSAVDLQRLDFPDLLAEKLNAAELDPQKVIIELTETNAIKQIKVGLDILIRLRLKGFNLSIDDYGTGTAALGQVKSLPFTELKIDRSFIIDINESPKAAKLVRNTIALSHDLGLKVVAEGVEDQQTLRLLQQYDCDIIQGYVFSKPLPPADLLEWIKQHNRKI